MTVEELISELMASCQSLDDQVLIAGSYGMAGAVTRLSWDDGNVILNDYGPPQMPLTRAREEGWAAGYIWNSETEQYELRGAGR